MTDSDAVCLIKTVSTLSPQLTPDVLKYGQQHVGPIIPINHVLGYFMFRSSNLTRMHLGWTMALFRCKCTVLWNYNSR